MSAELAKAMVWQAIQKLQETQMQIVTARSQANDISIHLNTATNAATDAITAQLYAIGQLREAINQAQAALVGSANMDASAALVWLNQVDLTLQDDSVTLNDIKRTLQTQVARNSTVISNADQNIKQITNAANALREHITGHLG